MRKFVKRFLQLLEDWRTLPHRFHELQIELNYRKASLHHSVERQSWLAAEIERLQIALAGSASDEVPGLTPAQIERLAWLIEECGEVAQAACKVLRHGYASASPFGGAINQVGLERELGDLRAAVQMLETAGDVRRTDVAHWHKKKAISVHKWMHHQRPVNSRE